jgi:hypothetical protein
MLLYTIFTRQQKQAVKTSISKVIGGKIHEEKNLIGSSCGNTCGNHAERMWS